MQDTTLDVKILHTALTVGLSLYGYSIDLAYHQDASVHIIIIMLYLPGIMKAEPEKSIQCETC